MGIEYQMKAMSNSDIVRVLGRRFKEYRLAGNMTQEEVANQAGVGLVTLRNFEKGKAYNITMTSLTHEIIELGRAKMSVENIKKLIEQYLVSLASKMKT